jgi:hypothetical protein
MEPQLPVAQPKRPALQYCQTRLAYSWGIVSALNFVILIAKSQSGGFIIDKINLNHEIWSWFLPTTIPFCTLIIGSMIHDPLSTQPSVTVSRPVFVWTMGLSWLYLLVLFVLVVRVPIFTGNMKPMDFLHDANLYITPLQGSVGTAMGLFFASRRPNVELPQLPTKVSRSRQRRNQVPAIPEEIEPPSSPM